MYLTEQLTHWRSNTAIPHWMVVILLIASILFQLYPTFNAHFIGEDWAMLHFVNKHPNVVDAALEPIVGDWTTPIPNTMFWLLFQVFRFNPVGYYLVSGLWHIFNSLLVLYLVQLITRRDGLAFGAAFIFALHFVHFSDWGPLVWISALTHLVMASFYLGALIFFVRYLQGRNVRNYIGALACLILGLASKETAASIPLLLTAWYIIENWPIKSQWRRMVILLGPFFAILAVYLSLKVLVHHTSDRYVQVGLYGIGFHIITNWKYFSNLVMPNPESPPVHSFLLGRFPAWTFSLALLMAAVVRVGLLAAAVWLWWRGPKHARYWLALAVIAYLPVVGFTGGHAGPHRYFYLPLVGCAALGAWSVWWLITWLAERGKFARTSVSLLALVVLGFWTYNLLPIRTWQKQVQANTQITREVIQMVGDQLSSREVPITSVYLKNFPSRFNDSGYMPLALRLIYNVGVNQEVSPCRWHCKDLQDCLRCQEGLELQKGEDKPEEKPPADALILQYRGGRVVVSQPY